MFARTGRLSSSVGSIELSVPLYHYLLRAGVWDRFNDLAAGFLAPHETDRVPATQLGVLSEVLQAAAEHVTDFSCSLYVTPGAGRVDHESYQLSAVELARDLAAIVGLVLDTEARAEALLVVL